MEKTVMPRREQFELDLPATIPLTLHLSKSPLLGDSAARYSVKTAKEMVGPAL